MERTLLSDTDAISPVIGVVLIVGITVVLMGVIGSFVLNSGPGTQPPDANFAVTEQGDADSVDVRYTGGPDVVLKEDIEVRVNGDLACDGSNNVDWNTGTSALDVGDSITFDGSISGADCTAGSPTALSSGDVVRIVWTSDDGTTSDILASYELQGT